MQQRRDIAVSLCALGLLGCTQTIHLSPPAASPSTSLSEGPVPHAPATANVHEDIWVNHFLLGFVGRKDIDTREHCHSRTVTEIKLGYSALTVLLWPLTLFIYTPRRIELTCALEESAP